MSGRFDWLTHNLKPIITTAILLAIGISAAVTYPYWYPSARQWLSSIQNRDKKDLADDPTATDDTGHSHAADTVQSLELSPVAWKNISLITDTVSPGNFTKTDSVPAVVVERPGRSQIDVTSPMTGIVTRIYPFEGEAVVPGQPLFELRVNHEDIVTAQREFLTTIQELDVINREITRLEAIGTDVIPARRILEKEYERDIATAKFRSMRQALLLHGLNESQVQQIEDKKEVVKNITIVAPQQIEELNPSDGEGFYHVQSLSSNRGQSVETGHLLATLADHRMLYLQGQAFEEDADQLIEAAKSKQKLAVLPVTQRQNNADQLELEVLRVADHVDEQSRALNFYLMLPNELARDEQSNGRRFVSWKYRPGERFDVQVPTKIEYVDQIVLPTAAVVVEGPNAYVFEQNGEHFDRIEVHVLFRDKHAVVLENDGRLIGSTIAMTSAHEMQLALKNQAGGSISHHGHTH